MVGHECFCAFAIAKHYHNTFPWDSICLSGICGNWLGEKWSRWALGIRQVAHDSLCFLAAQSCDKICLGKAHIFDWIVKFCLNLSDLQSQCC